VHFVSKYLINIFVSTFSQYFIFFELSQEKDLTKKERIIRYKETIDRKEKLNQYIIPNEKK
jgi:hypothetical protein